MRAYMTHQLEQTMAEPPSKSRKRFRLEAMTRRLDLTAEQRDQIEKILEESASERDEVMGDCSPALDELRQRTDDRINAVLTEKQRTEYDAFMKKLRERRHRHRGAHSGEKRHRRKRD